MKTYVLLVCLFSWQTVCTTYRFFTNQVTKLIKHMSIRLFQFLPPASEGCGRYCFHRCLSVHTQRYPRSRFFSKSLVPGSFGGGVSQSWSGGYPSPSQEVPQDRGTPLARTGLGYLPARTGLGPPPPFRTGLGYPGQDSRASICYAAGFLVLFCFCKLHCALHSEGKYINSTILFLYSITFGRQ